MKRVDDSLFQVLRAVTLMITADGRVAPEEEKWLTHIMGTCSLSKEQHKQLLADLVKPPALETIFPHIRPGEDRERLMNLAQIAMHIDGKADPREKEFYDRLLAMEQAEYATGFMADELIKQSDRNEIWKSLEAVGRLFRARRRGGLRSSFKVDPPPKKK